MDMAEWGGVPLLPQWNIKEIGEVMRAQLQRLDSGKERVGRHTKCFRGSDAVDWMIEAGVVKTEDEALKIGNIMLARFAEDEFDRIVAKEGIWNIKLASFDYPYLSQLAGCMRCEVVLVDKGYFTGCHGCAWLRQVGIAKTEQEAIAIGNALLRVGLLHHIARRKLYEPGKETYQFAIDSFRKMVFKKAKSRSPAKKQIPCVGLDGILITAGEMLQSRGDFRSGEGQLPAGTPAGGVGYPHMDTITYRNVPVLPDSKIMDYLTAYITSVSSADYLFSDPVVSMMVSPSRLADILAHDSNDEEDVLGRILNDVMDVKGSERAFNDSIAPRSSAESTSCHRIIGGDGERHVKQQISLHQDGDLNRAPSQRINHIKSSKWDPIAVDIEFLRELEALGNAFPSPPSSDGKLFSSCVHGYHPPVEHILPKTLGHNQPIATLMAMDQMLSVEKDDIFTLLHTGSC